MINLADQLPTPVLRRGRQIGLAIVVGALAGLAAVALESAIHHGSELLIGRFSHVGDADLGHFDWFILLMPAAGALLAGLIVQLLAPDARGHGVEQMTRAFHRHLGVLPLRGPAVKAAGTAVVISTGGSAGPEGPVAGLCSAIGSTVAKIVPMSPQERRILLIAGCAAGTGAIFRCPLGGALFATSILYREPEFESDAIVPSFVASVIGYSVFMLVLGYDGPMLDGVSNMHFVSASDLPWYALLGLLCGVMCMFFYYCMHIVERIVRHLRRVPPWALAGFGGLATGAVACLVPQVMDGQYTFVQNTLNGAHFDHESAETNWLMWAGVFGIIAMAKCVATAFTVGSGAPGGMLGPSVFIGGMVGAAVSALGHQIVGDSFSSQLGLALIPVGMAGVLAGTMCVPLAAIVMTTEMTGSFGLIAPLMLVCAISYLVGRRFGLNSEQVRTAADSPTHAADPVIHLLESWRVSDVMQRAWPMTVPGDAPVDEIIERLVPGTRPVIAVADGGELRGVISAVDLGSVMHEADAAGLLIAADIMTTNLVTLRADDDLYTALEVFTRVDHEVLPVMTRGRDAKWVGMLARRDVVTRLHDQLEESRRSALAEHTGLQALDREVRVDQLITGVPARHADVQRLFVPIDVVGKSLRECDFRKKYNAQVIGIEQRDGSLVCPPDLDAPLRTDQRLLAVVWKGEEQPPPGPSV